jgi:hypothetical protein
MNTIRAAILRLLLRMLDAREREVIEGDFMELDLRRTRAISELIGLLARRQVAAWLDWRPWSTLAAIVLPFGMVLSLVSRYWAHGSAIYAWLYIDNWTSAYLASPGARRDLLDIIGTFGLECSALILWAWTTGFAVASASRRTVWVTYAAFGFLVFAGTLGSTTVGVRNPANAAVFSLPLYRVGFPIAFRILFVLLPAFFGMRRSVRESSVAWMPAAALGVTVVVVTALVARGPQGAVMFGWSSLSTNRPMISAVASLRQTWRFWLLPCAMTLPALYVVSNASWRTWRGRTS